MAAVTTKAFARVMWRARDVYCSFPRAVAELPPRLSRSMAVVLREVNKGRLRRAAQALSALYRLKMVSIDRIPEEDREAVERRAAAWVRSREIKRRWRKAPPAEERRQAYARDKELRPVVYSDLDALAYIALRLPSIHAVMTRMMVAIAFPVPVLHILVRTLVPSVM